MAKYVAPDFGVDRFNCPHCGAFSHHSWEVIRYRDVEDGCLYPDASAQLAKCLSCKDYSFWIEKRLVYPVTSTAPVPSDDMPQDVKADYEEARDIAGISPRGAAALLRLALQKLCVHLGEKGKKIDDDIANLVKKGLPGQIQKSLDILRVVGNNAVHPGQISLHDNPEMVQALFGLLNLICDVMITQPKQIDTLYQILPVGALQAIDRRDGKE